MLTADWSFSNSLQIAAAIRSDLILYDLSKMAIVFRKKIGQDVIKSLKLAPFSDFVLAAATQPSYCVQIMNMRSNQNIPIIQKEPIAGIGWLKQRQVLVNISNLRYALMKHFSHFRLWLIMRVSPLFNYQINEQFS